MEIVNDRMDNQVKLLNILSKSYNKILKDLGRIDEYLFEDDIPYACEDIYDRMTNIIKEAIAIDGIDEENKFIKNYINTREIILHNTLKEAFDACTKYAKEVADEKENLK